MALAIHFDRLIREGAVGNYSELAQLARTPQAWITAIMKLADLPVAEQEGVLSGRFSLTPACRPLPNVSAHGPDRPLSPC